MTSVKNLWIRRARRVYLVLAICWAGWSAWDTFWDYQRNEHHVQERARDEYQTCLSTKGVDRYDENLVKLPPRDCAAEQKENVHRHENDVLGYLTILAIRLIAPAVLYGILIVAAKVGRWIWRVESKTA